MKLSYKFIIVLGLILTQNSAIYSQYGWFHIANGTTNNLYCMSLASPNTGTVVGLSGAILRTINGGRLNRTLINFGSGSWLKDISANTIVITGQGGAIKSTDGGSNRFSHMINTGYRINKVSFSDTSNGYAVGDNGTIIHITTGGWLPPLAHGLVAPNNNTVCFSLNIQGGYISLV